MQTENRSTEEIRAEITKRTDQALDLDALLKTHERNAESEKQAALSGDRAAIERGALAFNRIKMLESTKSEVDSKLEELREELETAELEEARSAAVAQCAVEADEANTLFRAILEERARLAGAIQRAFTRIAESEAKLENTRAAFVENFDILVPRAARLSFREPASPDIAGKVRKYLEDISCQNDGVSLDIVLYDARREPWTFSEFGDESKVFPETTQAEKDADWILNEIQVRLDDEAESERRRAGVRPTALPVLDPMQHYTAPELEPRTVIMPNSKSVG